MTTRHVPDEVRNERATQTARTGRSLQEHMLDEVIRLAAKPSLADLVVDLRERKRRSGRQLGRDAILADRDADRR